GHRQTNYSVKMPDQHPVVGLFYVYSAKLWHVKHVGGPAPSRRDWPKRDGKLSIRHNGRLEGNAWMLE
ncbi:hypothetical protein, partial [Thauera sp. Sel9]|uniref:hypothetical protein n=1 Tax=Thauera sp. Sel9 TaxID=2974299 RepID=UPI0021E15E43